jgi:hypothetical protein
MRPCKRTILRCSRRKKRGQVPYLGAEACYPPTTG